MRGGGGVAIAVAERISAAGNAVGGGDCFLWQYAIRKQHIKYSGRLRWSSPSRSASAQIAMRVSTGRPAWARPALALPSFASSPLTMPSQPRRTACGTDPCIARASRRRSSTRHPD